MGLYQQVESSLVSVGLQGEHINLLNSSASKLTTFGVSQNRVHDRRQ